MARREPGIRWHGNRWQIRVRMGKGQQRLCETLPIGATYEDAVAQKAQILRDRIDVAQGKKPDLSIEQLLDRWIIEEASKQDSWSVTKYRVEVLRPYVAGVPISQIQSVVSVIKQFELAKSTINRYLSILRRISNLAESPWGLIERAPKITVFSEKGLERHVYLTPKEVQDLAQVVKACNPTVADLIVLTALTGLRRGEMLESATIQGSALILSANTKGKKPRVVPLTPEALQIARRCIPWTIKPRDIRREFERAREAVGLSHVQFRDLRHTFASWVIQDGQNTKVLQELLGHAQLSTTQRYAHLGSDHLKGAIAGLPTIRNIDGSRAGPKVGRKPRKKAAATE